MDQDSKKRKFLVWIHLRLPPIIGLTNTKAVIDEQTGIWERTEQRMSLPRVLECMRGSLFRVLILYVKLRALESTPADDPLEWNEVKAMDCVSYNWRLTCCENMELLLAIAMHIGGVRNFTAGFRHATASRFPGLQPWDIQAEFGEDTAEA